MTLPDKIERTKFTYIYFTGFGDYNKIIRKNVAESYENIVLNEMPWENMGVISGLLYRLHCSKQTNAVLNLPFKKIWGKYCLAEKTRDKIKGKSNLCFCLAGMEYGFITIGFIDCIRREYPNAKIVLFLTDKIEFYIREFKGFDIERIKKIFDKVFTYNKIDADAYGLLVPPARACFRSVEIDKSDIVYDIVFVGKNKGRHDLLVQIAQKCYEHSLKVYFYITDVPFEKRVKIPGIVYGDGIPYSELLLLESRSKCILNYMQDGSDGFTMRDYEAIGMNKILITNGKAVVNSNLFTDSKVVLLNDLFRCLDKIRNFDPNQKWNNIETIGVENYYRWFDEILSV